jgi:flagellar basal-body rod protein FlgC
MGLFDSLSISASGLSAERLRMDVTAENLANAQSTRGADGQPYRRKQVVLQATGDNNGGFQTALARASAGAQAAQGAQAGQPGGVEVAAIVEDASPGRRVYDPGHPDADPTGYITMPNVDSVTEMVDLISASRAYEANVTAMQTAKSMFTKTLDLLR